MRVFFSLIACALFALGLHAQMTSFRINKTNCGIYSTPQRCLNVSVTKLDANNKPTGEHGNINVSYYPRGYSPINFGFVSFNHGLDGLKSPNIAEVDTDSSLFITGADATGKTFYGHVSYTFTTYRATGNCGLAACPINWTITGGIITIFRVDY
jgi:hypothetical protein